MPSLLEELQVHQRDRPVDAGHALAIVGHRADRARNVRPVAVVVHRVAVVVRKIIAVNVVDEAVAVVILAVAGGFAGIRPDVRCKIAMGVVDAGVEHRHDDARASSSDVPGIRRIDGVHAPELTVLRIAGDRLDLIDRVALETGDVDVRAEPALHGAERRAGTARQHHARHPQSFDDLELDAAAGQETRRLSDGANAAQRGGVELDDPIKDVLLFGRRSGGLRRGDAVALDRPIGYPGMRRDSSASNVLKPERRDQRGGTRGVHKLAAFERLDSQAAVNNAGPISRGFAKQPILTGQKLGDFSRHTTDAGEVCTASMAMHGGIPYPPSSENIAEDERL